MWRLCKYVFYVSYCIEQQKKWNNKKWAATIATGWLQAIILFNMLALVAVAQLITGIPLLTRLINLLGNTSWIILSLLIIGSGLYFELPARAEIISSEFDRTSLSPKIIKRHNLYIWLELLAAIAVFIACLVLEKMVHG